MRMQGLIGERKEGDPKPRYRRPACIGLTPEERKRLTSAGFMKKLRKKRAAKAHKGKLAAEKPSTINTLIFAD